MRNYILRNVLKFLLSVVQNILAIILLKKIVPKIYLFITKKHTAIISLRENSGVG